jgi:hypothetical protein
MTRILRLLLFACLYVAFIAAAQAQVTIFNVPAADIAKKGQIWQENEGQFRPYSPGQFYGGTHYTSIGLPYNCEFDLTNINFGYPYNRNIGLGVGARTVIPILKKRFEKQELKLQVGELLPISFGGGGVGSWTYVLGHCRLPRVKTRITAGVSLGPKQLFGRNLVCFAGGIEHPVTDKLVLQADWYSGKNNSLGLFIPGFSYTLPKDLILFAGFQIPNSRQNGKTGFVVEVGKFFNPPGALAP